MLINFIDNTEEIIDSLVDDLKNNDFEKIKDKAHKIKGTSRMFLLNDISNFAKEMEELTKEKEKKHYILNKYLKLTKSFQDFKLKVNLKSH